MGLPQKQILRQGHEWAQCHREVVSGSIEGSGDVRRKDRRQQLATVGNWSGALLGTPGREQRACIRTAPIGAKSWAVYPPNPIHWGWGLGGDSPWGISSNFCLPFTLALRESPQVEHRRRLQEETVSMHQNGECPRGDTVRAPDSFCYCYSSKMFSLLTL